MLLNVCCSVELSFYFIFLGLGNFKSHMPTHFSCMYFIVILSVIFS